MLGAPLLPRSFFSLPLQSLPSATATQDENEESITQITLYQKEASPPSLPPPNLTPLVQHPNQFISFPRWSTRELTQGNCSPWLCPQPNRLEPVPPPSPAGSGEVAPPNSSAQRLSSLGSQSLQICPFFCSKTRQGRCRRGDGARAGPLNTLHQTCQSRGCHQPPPKTKLGRRSGLGS